MPVGGGKGEKTAAGLAAPERGIAHFVKRAHRPMVTREIEYTALTRPPCTDIEERIMERVQMRSPLSAAGMIAL